MNRLPVFVALASLTSTFGCRLQVADDEEALTLGEAQEALEETASSSDAESLMSANVDFTTHFTLGGGVEAAIGELGDFVRQNLPCAEVDAAGDGKSATMTITYGAKPGDCTYRGQTFSGSHTITVARNDDDTVEVDHVWKDLSNGRVEVDGTAKVTWDFENPSRRVVHEVTWTRLRDGRTGTGSGDRVQTPLDGDLALGIEVDGERSWSGRDRQFDLDIEAVAWRWADPIPQSGTYTLTFDAARLDGGTKTATLSFARVDDDTIAATLTGPKGKAFTFRVTSAGEVSNEASNE